MSSTTGWNYLCLPWSLPFLVILGGVENHVLVPFPIYWVFHLVKKCNASMFALTGYTFMYVFLCSRWLGLLKHYFSSKSWKPKLKRVYYYSETSVVVRLTLLAETAQTCMILYLYFNITWINRGLEDHQQHFCYLLSWRLLAQLLFTCMLGCNMWTAKDCLMSQVQKLKHQHTVHTNLICHCSKCIIAVFGELWHFKLSCCWFISLIWCIGYYTFCS